MGRRSRNRIRAGLQPPKQRPGDGQPGVPDGAQAWDLGRKIERRFVAALGHFAVGEGARAGEDLGALAQWWEEGAGRVPDATPGLVPEALCSYLTGAIEQTWQRGWQPADIQRVANRSLSSKHADLAVHAIAEESESYRSRQRTLPSWMDQLDEIGATRRWVPATDHLADFARDHDLEREGLLRTGIELVVMIHSLPSIPLLVPPPSEWDRAAALDAAVGWRSRDRGGEVHHLERIRALLAKAESTEFEDESEALTAKAQELMTRYSIDTALLAAHSAGRRTEPHPEGVRIGIDDPYAQAKAFLLVTIADVSRCRVAWSKHLGFSTVFGFEGDLRSVELLYTSLLLQARKAMVRAGETGGHSRSRSFRQSFLIGFATRIGRRLEEVASTVLSDALKGQGKDLLPVLAERSRVVEGHRQEAFPELGECRLSPRDWAGWASGKVAADLAEIARGPLLEEEKVTA